MTSRPEFERQHRRETFLYLTLPLLFTAGLVMGGAAIVLLLQRQAQVAIIADWMLTVLVCCPAILCLYVIAVGAMVTAALAGRAVEVAERPLEQLVERSDQVVDSTTQINDTIRRQIANLASRLAFVEPYFKIFDQSEENSTEEQDDTNPEQ